MGHSSSAYSLEVVKPKGSVTAASRITSCHPQKTNLASAGEKSVVWQVR